MSGTDAPTTATPTLERVIAQAEAVSEQGHELPSVRKDDDGGSTTPKIEVAALRLPRGEGATPLQLSGGLHYRLRAADAEQVPDRGLVALGSSPPMAFRVRSGRRPADRNSDGSPITESDWAGFTLLPLEPARCRPSEAAPDGAVPAAQASAAQEPDERPLVDDDVWKSHESLHHMRQYDRWSAAWGRMTERDRARVLELIYSDVLWDRLETAEREKALEAIRDDREWPTLRQRMEDEERQSRTEDAKRRRRELARLERERKARESQRAKEAEDRAAREKADREREEREEREREEQRARHAEEERERLQRERDELVGGVVVEMAP